MGKRKICIYCESWKSGGIESFLSNMIQKLDLSLFEIDIVVDTLEQSVFTRPLQGLGVQFYELSGKKRAQRANERAFVQLLQRRRYDVVHLNIFHALALRYLALAKRAGVAVRLAHSHNTALRESVGRAEKMLIHKLAKRLYTRHATDLWACSDAAAVFLFPKEELKSAGYSFIPNGIDTKRFQFQPDQRAQVRARLGFADAFVVGNVGRLCTQKNQSFLLEAFAALVARQPESRLLLVGDGEDEQMLRQKARRLGLSEAVCFHPTTTQVEELYWAMDLFAFPSRFEGLGIVAIEAQAAGLPVLCSQAIPREAKITAFIDALPLSAGAQGWAQAMLRAKAVEHPACAAAAVRAAGFEMEDVARLIAQRYGGFSDANA